MGGPPETRTRAIIAVMMLVVLTGLLAAKAAVLTLGAESQLQASMAIMNRTPQGFIELGNQVKNLRAMTSNIDAYNLAQIKEALASTARLAGYANSEFQAQYDAWTAVQGKISQDKESFQALRQRLDEVKRLQDGEILHLKGLLDQSAQPSLFDNLSNVFISFVAGVVSSIVATLLYGLWRRSRPQILGWWKRVIFRRFDQEGRS